jgi:phosphohistidine phosphatase SixA
MPTPPWLTRVALLAPLLACAAAPAPTVAPAPAQAAAPSTLVFVLRHAEKALDDPRDPSLSPAGEARAQALAALLRRAGVTHFYASEYRRTRSTLAPLAAAAGRELVILPANDLPALQSAIRALPAGSVVVVAGHSNTVPAIVAALGGASERLVDSPAGPALPDDAYDRLYLVVTRPDAPAQTLELHYGP